MKKKLLVPVIMMLLPLCNSLFMSKANAQTTDNKKQKDAIEIGIDSIWRSSDFEGETPVLRQQRKAKRVDGSASLPEGSERVGCICMDYFVLDRIGRGACTGHNGVRFWLYQLPSGDTVQIPTLRHEGHPDTLDNSTLLQLAAYKRYERVMAQRQIDFYTALEEHPEWLTRDADGRSIPAYNGQVATCLNGWYQQQGMLKILGEAIDRYPIDGVFFNMIGYPRSDYSGRTIGICQCENCRQRLHD